MEINQICFFNIGFADKISDDYFLPKTSKLIL